MQSNLLFSLAFICLASLVTAQLSIVTGPIIGKVTTTTARILIEFNASAPITVILTDPTGQQIQTAKTTLTSIPVPFAFEGLKNNTKYTVSLNDTSIPLVESYFTTLTGISGRLNFATFSCMDQYVQVDKEAKADLWADLLKRIQNNEVEYLIQTGDQVYMDDPFGKGNPNKPYFACMKLINATAQDQWNSIVPQCLELLRNEYRQTWNIESVREVQAKIPSLTILDDHQIRDDWGYLPQDSDPNSADYFYGTIARQVYYEYERQLREDVDFNNLTNITTDYYYEVLNDIGFFFLEYRAIRTWNRNYSNMGTSQIGLNQTLALQQVLDPVNGTFANLSNFFLVSPLTMVFLVEALVRIGYYSNNDAQESWSFKYKDEQIQVLNLLRNWKLAKPGREVTILDGDVHMAGFTDISYDHDFAYLQFTVSSIASSAPGTLTFLAFDAIKEIQHLQDPWDYEHHDWTNKFNYGIVLAREEANEAKVGCYLIKASDDEDPEMVGDDGDSISSSDWDDILQTF